MSQTSSAHHGDERAEARCALALPLLAQFGLASSLLSSDCCKVSTSTKNARNFSIIYMCHENFGMYVWLSVREGMKINLWRYVTGRGVIFLYMYGLCASHVWAQNVRGTRVYQRVYQQLPETAHFGRTWEAHACLDEPVGQWFFLGLLHDHRLFSAFLTAICQGILGCVTPLQPNFLPKIRQRESQWPASLEPVTPQYGKYRLMLALWRHIAY